MRYLVVDTETTGLTEADEILELAGVWRDDGHVYFHTSLCDVSSPIHPEASAAHHITKDDIRGQPVAGEVLERMLERFGDTQDMVLVAHNAAFDRGMLSRASSGRVDASRWICTYRCALHLWPDAPSYGNQVLRYWLGVEVDYLPRDLYPHRALYDALVTERILARMLTEQSLERLIVLSDTPVLLKTVRFGKHEGMPWSDVPRGYLRWILGQDFDEDVVHTARHYMER